LLHKPQQNENSEPPLSHHPAVGGTGRIPSFKQLDKPSRIILPFPRSQIPIAFVSRAFTQMQILGTLMNPLARVIPGLITSIALAAEPSPADWLTFADAEGKVISGTARLEMSV
jgi:hypothetical protein